MSSPQERPVADGTNVEETRLLRFSVFEKGGREIQFGVNTHKVVEVVEWERLSPLPESLLPFVGIYDFRGLPVPVVDISYQLVGTCVEPREKPKPRILVCEVMRRRLGLLVPKTSRISEHSGAEILPPPEDLGAFSDGLINGLVKEAAGSFTYLLDIEGLLGKLTKEPVPSGPPPGALRGLRVLVVEDSKLFQKRAAQYFSELECVFDIVENGERGLEKLRDPGSPGYDVIFSDIEMPVMNGIEMVKKIRADQKLCHIPVVFNSSISNPALIEEIRKQGLGDYVVKFDPRLIAAKLGGFVCAG